MKHKVNLLTIYIFLAISAYGQIIKTENKMDTLNLVSLEITIHASEAKVWDVITSPQYAKVLGNEFDEGAFMASDWKKGSKVEFTYEPDKVVATGTISELIEDRIIEVDYDFDGFAYSEKFILDANDKGITLKVEAGPYGEDIEEHKVVWNNWLLKVKELSEQN